MWLQHFEDFVVGHFCNRGRDILVACRAYMDGAPLRSVKGGVKDVNMDDRGSSRRSRNALAVVLMLFSRHFTKIGAKDCGKYLLPMLPEMKMKKCKAIEVQQPQWMV